MSGTAGGTPIAAANVLLDAASAHPWQALNERVFVDRAIAALRAELGTAFADLALFVFSPAGPAVRPASADVAHRRKVLIFLSDESASVPLQLSDSYLAIFKAYLPRDFPGTNIAAFSLGYAGSPPAAAPRPVADRTVDIFFSGNLNLNRVPLYQACHPWLRRLPPPPPLLARAVLATRLRRAIRRDFSETAPLATHIRFTDGFMAGLDPGAYAALLGRAKVVLCPRGFASAETFRHVEALRAGAVVVTTPLPDTVLYRGGPFVVVDDWRDGLARARALAGDLAELAARQAAGLAWYRDRLSPSAMGRTMAATIAGLSASRGVR